MTELLVLICAILALSIVAVMVTIAGLGMQHARQLRRATAVSRARDELTNLLVAEASSVASQAWPVKGLPELDALSRDEVRQLVVELGTSLGGESTGLLRAVAERAGVLAQAHKMLASRRWTNRHVAARVLTALGDTSVLGPALLRDDHPTIRAQAATWLGAGASPEVLDQLLELVGDPDGLVRFAAKNAVIRHGDSIAPLLIAKLDGSDIRLEGLLEVATQLDTPVVADAAAGLIAHQNARVRALVATVLAHAVHVDARDALAVLLDDPVAEVRRAAVAAFGELGHWEAAPRLATLLGDPAHQVRRQAGLTLLALGAPGVLLLREAARVEDGPARQLAHQALELYAYDLEGAR